MEDFAAFCKGMRTGVALRLLLNQCTRSGQGLNQPIELALAFILFGVRRCRCVLHVMMPIVA